MNILRYVNETCKCQTKHIRYIYLQTDGQVEHMFRKFEEMDTNLCIKNPKVLDNV